jgi:hypothetical protein
MNDPKTLFRRPDGRPLPARHHLDKHPRGAWRMAVTVDRPGSHYTGTRVKIPLHTRDEIEAGLRRDCVLEALCRAGCLCRDVVIRVTD